MKAAMMMLAMPVAAMAIEASQEQDTQNDFSAWRCGHYANSSFGETRALDSNDRLEAVALMNLNAGIVLLQDESLDYIRVDPAEIAAASAENQPRYLATSFDSLFCYDYIKRYKNNAGSPTAPAGMCIQNMNVGSKWDAILTADTAAKTMWEYFGTSYGFQKSTAVNKTHPTPDYADLWGSGRTGSNPSNWCGVYMKETLCHIAFPQYAENSTEPIANARVRPVCKDWCNSVMENCNRREPACYECDQDWINDFGIPAKNYSAKMDNSLYCDAWNKGYGEYSLTRAGTGVATGPDDEDEKYCAAWDAAPTVSPLSVMFVIFAAFAAVM